MTRDTLKGFIFGALVMLMTPAFAVQSDPKPAAVPQEEAAAPESLPYFRLTYNDAEEALAQALVERKAGTKLSARITNRDGDYVFSYRQPISVEIRGLRFDAQGQRFSANLVAISGKDVVSARAVSGRFDEIVQVPTLKHGVRAGDVIRDTDIEMQDYPKSRTRSDTITDTASLIGKSPERVISPNRPIRTVELAQPKVVKRNDLVKMVYQRGAMTISTNGQAMMDGIKGSVISVKNLSSNKLVQATVQDGNTVIIDNAEPKLSSLETGGAYENN